MASASAYTSHLSVPYSPSSPLNTLDIHTHNSLPSITRASSFSLLYIHGGAFRDPLVTSTSLIPSLPSLFKNPCIKSIASINYRLSPHPKHPTHPSKDEKEGVKEGRNAKWPTHIEDVREGIRWLKIHGGDYGWGAAEWIAAGHSVGGTMGMMLGLEVPDGSNALKRGQWGEEKEEDMQGLKAVVAIEGIYDFVACRDAHVENRDLYDGFTSGAFGAEEDGEWESGNVIRCGRRVREEVEFVSVVHSKGDELVEWEQAEGMVKMLREEGEKGMLVEVKGMHQEIVTEGEVIGKVVGKAVESLIARRNRGS